MKYTVERPGIKLICETVKMGDDLQLCLYGGEKPHIGTMVMSEPRGSLTGKGYSATSSVINRVSHKDEKIARMMAEKIVSEKNILVCCSAGVHIDNASADALKLILSMTEELTCKIISDI
ncbi:MAG: hypothetical protein K5894_06605 [Lachnospiraceae bacterium]|nr:hypothetical protein [Lachnospiraceae bacterium]